MIALARGEFEDRRNIRRLEQWIILENLLIRGPRREKVQNVFDANA